jgi:anti-anti-sigma factor
MNIKFDLSTQHNTDTKDIFATIKVQGELNANTAILFEDEIKKVFSAQPQNIFLDLSDVTLIVSSAIGSLLLFQDIITQKGFKFLIVSINEKIKGILLMMGLDNLMEI